MRFVESLKEGLELIKLNREAYPRVAGNPAAFSWALLITALAGVAGGLSPGSIGSAGFLWMPVVAVIGLFVGSAIIHVLAGLFGGKGDLTGLIRILGLSNLLGWAGIIPFVGWLVSLWIYAVLFVSLREHYKLDALKAVIVMLIPLAVLMVFAVFFGLAAIMALFAGGALKAD
jgi:hypothetical protein